VVPVGIPYFLASFGRFREDKDRLELDTQHVSIFDCAL
jgi:hypothetical protein